MAYEIVMPQLGLSMDKGQIIQWVKKNGELVQEGEILLEVESDKAVVEVEAVESGILHILSDPEDGEIPIGQVIGFLLSHEEQVPVIDDSLNSEDSSFFSQQTRQILSDPMISTEYKSKRPDRPPSSPAARRKAKELGLDWRAAEGTGPGNRIKERDVLRLAAQLGKKSIQPGIHVAALEEELDISPVARKLAEAVGLDLASLAIRYPGKRIERADVEAMIREALAKSSRSKNLGSRRRASRRESLIGLRRTIADRMTHSIRTNAPVTLTTRSDATEIVQIRENLDNEANFPIIPSYNAILVKVLSIALSEYPIINSSLVQDEIVFWESINIGVAVDTERGLIVPVIRDAQAKNLWEIAEEMNGLLDRAIKGKALPDELIDGTFTLTNLGNYDVDYFTPIINTPECAVLGVGKMEKRIVFMNGEGNIRKLLPLSLTFDHRLVDGAPAARFLKRIKHLIEKPYLWWSAK
jgi:pyruvate dehydrogenase E2 component (dihydrolipoamide acetyltransferase)